MWQDIRDSAPLAGRLITDLALPAGGRPAVPRPVPALLRHPGQENGSGHTIDLHEFVSIRQSMGSAAEFLLAHVPAGMKWSGNGTASGAGGQQETFVSDTVPRPPAGIYQGDLVLSVVTADGGSLLRADAQVTWFPPRTQAEHVGPARFRAVTVSATLFNSRRHTTRRTFTAGAVMARLAQALNSLHAEPGLVITGLLGLKASRAARH